jgi:hypothetical protein
MPDARYFVNEWFNVVECINCGLGFVNPRPTRSEIARYYPSSFYDYFDHERDYHLHRYAAEAKFLPKIASDNHKLLLDLGCANGDFPRFMQKRGWKVEGVEVSESSKRITDFKVYKQEFKEIAAYEPRYDAITAWAIFVFLVTNFKSLSSRCLFLEDVPRHLYFFTEETINKYLTISGFELIKKDYSNKIYSMRPVNFLRYYFYRYIYRRRLKWSDMQFTRPHFFEKDSLRNCWMKNLKYIISSPLYVVDRLLMPIYERYQIISKTYGIVTYVARRR